MDTEADTGDFCRIFVAGRATAQEVSTALRATGRYAADASSLVRDGVLVDVRRNKSMPRVPAAERAAILEHSGEWFGWPVVVDVWRESAADASTDTLRAVASGVRDDLRTAGCRVKIVADLT
ncbi:hypothetical protein GCM10010124_28400 [Pilimelia terevasa]|uniref:Uncharacterized protein n=1 Tax=Pilimelia terevasa TaxID=53372 RepID=A0A8J3BTB1_9ACTN|nr:hypothetical protein [Pilimelia terevasa]GGK34116.1 hypothetical protein GCM10010124_28400 [Pilimelia terevasa]